MPLRDEAETPRRCGRCAAAVAALLLLVAGVGALAALTRATNASCGTWRWRRPAALEVETRRFMPSALVAEVTVDRTFADGASAPRDTTFAYENDSCKHPF